MVCSALCCCVVLLAVLIPVRAAAGAGLYQSSPRAMQTGTPAPGGTVVFEDDFATYSSRWIESESPKSSVSYRDNGLALRVVSPGVTVWSVPDFAITLDSYTVQVTVTFQAGSTDSWFGCVLAYASENDFYAFLVSVEGDWQFVHHLDGEWLDLTPDNAERVTFSDDITGGLRLIQIDVTADVFSFAVDEQSLGAVAVDDDLHGAGFGVIARAGHGYVEVTFDTVLVSEFAGDMQRGTSD